MRTLRANPPSRPAFSLVEMMVVITLIAVLVSILVPAVNAARNAARGASTKATIQALSTGLETYKANGRLGGVYPPSTSDGDDTTGSGTRQVKSPYSGSDIEMSGAGLLVWALSGADMQGTPGFRKLRSGSTKWADDTDSTFNSGTPTESGAYALYPTGNPREGQPVQPRVGPLVDSSRVKITANLGTAAEPNFEIPAERDARRGPANRQYPLYLDAFGSPVLYWRADPAGYKIADAFAGADSGNNRGIYHFGDNIGLLRAGLSAEDGLWISKAQTDGSHPLSWDNSMNGAGRTLGTRKPLEVLQPGTFPYYICDPGVGAKMTPYRRDSYLLVSPGPDGVFGNTDDIANFDHNGR